MLSFTWGAWFVVIAVLGSWVTMVLFAWRDAGVVHVLAAEIVQQVDVTAAALVCLATHAKRVAPDSRDHRKGVQLCSNRAFTLMLLLAFSQLALSFATIDNFVRINGPGFIHFDGQFVFGTHF